MTRQSQPSSDIERYIGLMCGTSIDGVDVALVEFSPQGCQMVDAYLHPVSSEIKNKLRSLCSISGKENYLERYPHRIELLGELDTKMGEVFAASVNQFVKLKQIDKRSISAIGSHGQTIRHQPTLTSPFTLQIGDPNIIASRTGITTVADFRRMDIAVGGQGAPLAPAFHNASMRSDKEDRIILNLGGVANITLLPKDPAANVIGFDTGTANTLIDAWYLKHHDNPVDDFDRDSQFAQQGNVDNILLAKLCDDPYFQLPPPKSTGREYFSIDWLEAQLDKTPESLTAADVQRTLLEFTAVTISDAISKLDLTDFSVYTCGGGSHSRFLIERLYAHIQRPVLTTDALGISGDYLEAITFAWLARQRIHQLPGNLPSVTGARESKVLGAIYLP